MKNRLLSELNFHRARRKSGQSELDLLKKSLAQHGSNVNSAARWLIRSDADNLGDNMATSQTAFASTLFMSLRKLRDAKTNSKRTDFEFEQFVVNNAFCSVSQVFQDLWVLFETGEKKNGYFVEFGATNGVDISNTLLLEKSYKWQGILAEPNPFWHKQLRQARSATIETKCVAARSGETLELYLTQDPEFASTTKDVTASGMQPSKKLSVDTISLAQMLEEYAAPEQIDFLSIDTEGSELDILSAYNFSKERKIRLIAVEHNFEIKKRQGLHTLLTSNGYARRYTAYSMFDDWYALES